MTADSERRSPMRREGTTFIVAIPAEAGRALKMTHSTVNGLPGSFITVCENGVWEYVLPDGPMREVKP